MIDTTRMIWEEKMVLDYLREARGEVRAWTVMISVVRQMQAKDSTLRTIPTRKIVLDLCYRLICEKKIVRDKKKRTFRISAIYE